MKNNLFKLYILVFFVFTDFVAFAQPGDDTVDGDLEGNDPLPVPVNGKLVYLAVAGLLYAIYAYRNSTKLVK